MPYEVNGERVEKTANDPLDMAVEHQRVCRRNPLSICHGLNIGSDYSLEELDFLRAMDRYKREHRRPFPTWREVLGVLKALGYTKEGASSQTRSP